MATASTCDKCGKKLSSSEFIYNELTLGIPADRWDFCSHCKRGVKKLIRSWLDSD